MKKLNYCFTLQELKNKYIDDDLDFGEAAKISEVLDKSYQLSENRLCKKCKYLDYSAGGSVECELGKELLGSEFPVVVFDCKFFEKSENRIWIKGAKCED